MKKYIILIVSIVFVAVVSSISVFALNNGEFERLSYEIKSDYASYSEVVADKEAFLEYKEIYYKEMLTYLAKISKLNDEAYAKTVEEDLRYDYLSRDIEDEFNKRLALFEPNENDILKSKEKLLHYYSLLLNSTPKEQESTQGKNAQAALDNYNKGLISIDEALFQSGCVSALKNISEQKLSEDDSYYNNFLSKFNMSTWFDIDEYIKANNWGKTGDG